MSTLDRKLLRDLSRLRGQVLTIGLVVAAGIAGFVTLRSTWASLEESKSAYYERYRFGDVFAHITRAPSSVADQLEAVPGVAVVYPRIVHRVMMPMPGMSEPATGTMVSLPPGGVAPLDDLYLRSGRLPEAGRADEVVVVESFANAHDLRPGDQVPAVINGTLRHLRIVGIALSPEFVFAATATDFVGDDKRIAVLWMDREVLAPAFRMEGAFNDVVMSVQPGASLDEVLLRVDQILEPYGGVGAVPRSKQTSNFMLEGEMTQLRLFATIVPIIFLAVAAFLLNVVLSRLVNLQRQQIAVLKAVGYGNRRIGLHYLQLVSVIVVIGAVLGVIGGVWLGGEMTEMYRRYFRFPNLRHHAGLDVIATGVLVSLAAAVVGALATVRAVARLPPAEAMRPQAPPTYERSFFDRLGLGRLLGPSATMVVRELTRRPLRLILSALGISAAVGILVVGRFSYDSFDHLVNTIMHREYRGDTTVTFYEPMPERVVRELGGMPGVLDAEGQRMVPVRFSAGARHRDSSITGFPASPRLKMLINREANQVVLPAHGLAVSAKLAEILGVGVGDEIVVEVRQGQRPTFRMPVSRLVDDSFGLQGYMGSEALHSLLGEETSASIVYLKTDPLRADDVRRRLQEMPSVAGVTRTDNLIERFNEQSGSMMLVMTLIMTLFGTIIAVGVVYNNARVALSLRSRDLASLRVLGFTRKEISSILLGELAVQVVIALPVGLLMGTWWSHALMSSVDPETYRLPTMISNQTYLYAALVTGAAGVVSALMVRRKLDHLDLIGVLKTRE